MVLFKSIFINYNYRLFRDLSVQKSVHSRYNVRGIRKISLKRKSPKTNCFKAFLRAGERIRTADRLITNQLLYQLSYTSLNFCVTKLALSDYSNKNNNYYFKLIYPIHLFRQPIVTHKNLLQYRRALTNLSTASHLFLLPLLNILSFLLNYLCKHYQT